MKNLFVIVGCVAVLALSACNADNEADQESVAREEADETVFSGYVENIEQAKQAKHALEASRKKLKERLDRVTSGE